MRNNQSYTDVWYDANNIGETAHQYYYTPTSKDGDLYFTVETYPYQVIPMVCLGAVNSFGSTVSYPIVYIKVVQNGTNMIGYKYFYNVYHDPILITEANYKAGEELKVEITYQWAGSPIPDYTLKVYSKH